VFLIDMFPFTDEMDTSPILIVLFPNHPSSTQILANLNSLDPKLYLLCVSGIISAFNSPPNIPVAPCGPVAPVTPCIPTGPVDPCGPVAPCTPVAPVGPVGPIGPVGPVGPVTPEPLTTLSLYVRIYPNDDILVTPDIIYYLFI
jgi:hypothetical protein